MDDAGVRQGPDQGSTGPRPPARGVGRGCSRTPAPRRRAPRRRRPGGRLALQILKSVYATFLGGMTRSADLKNKGTLRPDWHDQYVTTLSLNALRALDKARAASGVTPIGLMKDAAWWVTAADAAPFKPAGMDIMPSATASPASGT